MSGRSDGKINEQFGGKISETFSMRLSSTNSLKCLVNENVKEKQ